MKFLKILIPIVLCATLLVGLTGCVEELANALNNLFSDSAEQTEGGTSEPISEQSTPSENNEENNEVTTPGVTTSPIETTLPTETSKPEETSSKPTETTSPIETTTVNGGTVVTPNEDLPADADGYRYPEFFYNLVNKTMADAIYIGNDSGYENILKSQTPEIIFVERGATSDYEYAPIVIYAKYCTNSATNEYIYTRLSFTTGGNDYGRLGRPNRYSSYAEYISAVQAALEKKAEVVNIDVSSIEERQDALNDRLGENFARCLGSNFVDATVNHARMHKLSGVSGDVCEISGFAYDEEGKSYSYVVQYQLKGTFENMEYIVGYLEDGKMQVEKDFKMFEVTSMPVAGVFQAPENAE